MLYSDSGSFDGRITLKWLYRYKIDRVYVNIDTIINLLSIRERERDKGIHGHEQYNSNRCFIYQIMPLMMINDWFWKFRNYGNLINIYWKNKSKIDTHQCTVKGCTLWDFLPPLQSFNNEIEWSIRKSTGTQSFGLQSHTLSIVIWDKDETNRQASQFHLNTKTVNISILLNIFISFKYYQGIQLSTKNKKLHSWLAQRNHFYFDWTHNFQEFTTYFPCLQHLQFLWIEIIK